MTPVRACQPLISRLGTVADGQVLLLILLERRPTYPAPGGDIAPLANTNTKPRQVNIVPGLRAGWQVTGPHTSSISKVDQLACERTCRVRIDALEQCRLNKLLVAVQQIAHHLVREHSRPRQRGPLAKPLEPCTAVVVLRPRSERWFYG